MTAITSFTVCKRSSSNNNNNESSTARNGCVLRFAFLCIQYASDVRCIYAIEWCYIYWKIERILCSPFFTIHIPPDSEQTDFVFFSCFIFQMKIVFVLTVLFTRMNTHYSCTGTGTRCGRLEKSQRSKKGAAWDSSSYPKTFTFLLQNFIACAANARRLC